MPNKITENPHYLTQQLITYIGNKRALLSFIERGLKKVKKRLNQTHLDVFDVFSGSGVVARFLKQHAKLLIVNDLEKYSFIINQCYLANQKDLNLDLLKEIYDHLKAKLVPSQFYKGILSQNYAPQNDRAIQKGERVFYTQYNAQYIDSARQHISLLDPSYQPFFLAPLLSQASIHANTAGVFKGFYKCKKTGIGRFGGTNQDALSRITKKIDLPFPIFSRFNCQTLILQEDANKAAISAPSVDLAYLDPPYNQHPYGSNYFMLNLILDYQEPLKVSKVSGIPLNWKQSFYNKKPDAFDTFKDLVQKLKAKFLLISFNSEGFISFNQMVEFLNKIGKVEVLEQKYNTFRGSRNLRDRDIHIKEYLYLVEKY